MTPRLCYITDTRRGTAGRPLAEVVRRARQGGVELVILRERTLPKKALGALLETLLPLREQGLKLVIGRRLDLARAYALDGVQLAADAVPVREARAWLGPDALIGYSAHSGPEARRAEKEGASYVTLSPIYPTSSKPGAPGRGPAWLAEAVRGLGLPVLALGGLTPARTREVLEAGAWGVAAVTAIGAAPDVEGAAMEFRNAILENSQ